MSKKRTLSTTVFIACEGSNTEPLYFERLKEVMENEEGYHYAVTVYPDKNVDENPKTDALGLINVAIERKGEFDELWVVFDKDGYTKHKEAFKLAKENDISIAFSSISFETWLLLHFERNSEPFAKSADIINKKFLSNTKYLKDYAKKGDYYVYPKIQQKTQEAFKNASWLRNQIRTNNPDYIIHEVNPYTDVDCLVRKLLLEYTVYDYRELNQSLTFDDVEIMVYDNNNEYYVKITNSTNRSIVWNEFSFYDNQKDKINVSNSIIRVGNSAKTSLGKTSTSDKIFIEFKNLKLEINGVDLN